MAAKWAIVIWWLTVPGLTITMAFFGTWAADRDLPVEQLGSEIISSFVEQDQAIITQHRVYRRKLCPTKVERTFFDSTNTRWVTPDIDFAALGPLGADEYKQATPLPRGFPVGPARLQIVVSWKCNPVQWFWPVRYIEKDLRFEVIP